MYIYNCINIICWISLAIFFDKWWIALFSILFIMTTYTTKNYFRICDGCGKNSPFADDRNSAIDKAKEAGWIMSIKDGKIEDYCPECQSKMYGDIK